MSRDQTYPSRELSGLVQSYIYMDFIHTLYRYRYIQRNNTKVIYKGDFKLFLFVFVVHCLTIHFDIKNRTVKNFLGEKRLKLNFVRILILFDWLRKICLFSDKNRFERPNLVVATVPWLKAFLTPTTCLYIYQTIRRKNKAVHRLNIGPRHRNRHFEIFDSERDQITPLRIEKKICPYKIEVHVILTAFNDLLIKWEMISTDSTNELKRYLPLIPTKTRTNSP